ncbi:MAG: MBL fold metallo-hydrolase [Pseudomonadota bacterium]
MTEHHSGNNETERKAPDAFALSRRAVFAGALLPAAALLPAGAIAQSGGAGPVPTISRFRVGEFVVSALSDGHLPLAADVLSGVSAEDYASLLDQSGFRGSVYTAGVTAYLVETPTQRVLLDAGTGAVMGPTLGELAANLNALGIAPQSIDMVIATHLHPDHIGGLIANGVTAFTNAELVTHAADRAFWTDSAIKAQSPEAFQPFFDLAGGVLSVFDDRLRIVDGETDVVPGLTVVPLPGHTPGHMGVRIESGGDTVLMWGDIVHAAPIQLPRPDIAIAFDADQAAAVKTRQALFDQVATDRTFVLGSHLPFPGFGLLEKNGDGYRFIHAHWEYV